MAVELLDGSYGGVTEGPLWDGEAILFTNIPTSRILRYDPKIGEITENCTGTNLTNGLTFDVDGILYGCSGGGRCIVRFDPDGAGIPISDGLDGKRHNNSNDLAIDRQGQIWFADMWGNTPYGSEMELDHESVLRLGPDRRHVGAEARDLRHYPS